MGIAGIASIFSELRIVGESFTFRPTVTCPARSRFKTGLPSLKLRETTSPG